MTPDWSGEGDHFCIKVLTLLEEYFCRKEQIKSVEKMCTDPMTKIVIQSKVAEDEFLVQPV